MKTWIREKSLSYASDTNIILGLVWTDKNDPGSYVGKPVRIMSDMKINRTTKSLWKSAENSNIRAIIGIWIAFLKSIPLLGKLFVDWESQDDRETVFLLRSECEAAQVGP